MKEKNKKMMKEMPHFNLPTHLISKAPKTKNKYAIEPLPRGKK